MSVLAGGLGLALEQGWLRTLWDSFRPRGLHQFPSFHGEGVTQPIAAAGFCRLFRGSPRRPWRHLVRKRKYLVAIAPATPDRPSSR